MDRKCSYCNSSQVEDGFVEDRGGYGVSFWITGALKRGIFGGARRARQAPPSHHRDRCTECAHIDLFAIGDG